MTLPLQGLRVLDLTRWLPGPYASLLLADLGADVIKLEDPKGDPARGIPPFYNGESAFYITLNRNKRSVVLDLKTDFGREAFARLVPTVDVILEGFRPGVAARLGVDYESTRRLRPNVVYCSISAFGQNGPFRERPAHDLNTLAFSGGLDLSGSRDTPPIPPIHQIADFASGLMAAFSVVAALRQRDATGEGAFVDIGMFDAVFSWLMPLAAEWFGGHVPARGLTRLTGGHPSYNVYPTADGRYVAVGALEPHFWENLCRAVGREDLLADGFATGARSDEVVTSLAETFRTKTLAEWEERLAGVNTCFSPVLELAEAVVQPLVQARGLVREGHHDAAGVFKFVSTATGLDVELPARSAPRLGEHTAEVLREVGVDPSVV